MLSFASIFLLPLIFAYLVIVGIAYVQSPNLLAAHFSHLPYQKVLETRRWHGFTETNGCTYAIVALPQGAASTPAGEWASAEWQGVYGLWKYTPSAELTANAFGECEQRWSADTRMRLHAALANPGSYSAMKVGQSPDALYLLIYSAPYNVAAFIRYGD